MAILKCKMCGADLTITEDSKVCECEYCGSTQTVPSLDNEKKINLFTRANRLRMACEFDKASGVYESIVSEFQDEAEAYWGLILCKYGIEYVDDPKTGKKIPTCHRSSFDSVMEDSNFEMVMECGDIPSRLVYREEAKVIEKLRTDIIEVSSKEEPYDIFICYKETDENGDRTIDSVIAQDVYTELTEKGYKVFFSRITLEDKLGQEYEPYIFAALNSAKVMLAFGTNYEYYNAVWVKNEWSRFLSLIEKGEKKTLIPCYKDIDAYDIPAEFKRLQAQDMGKVGAIQDLVRGIQKIIVKESANQGNSALIISDRKNNALLIKALSEIEDKNWEEADQLCKEIINDEPGNSLAYLYKELIYRKCNSFEKLIDFYTYNNIKDSKNIKYAKKFADDETNTILNNIEEKVFNFKKENEKRIHEICADINIQEDIFTKNQYCANALNDKIIINYKTVYTVTSSGEIKSTSTNANDVVIGWTNIERIYMDGLNTIIAIDYEGNVYLNDCQKNDIPDWAKYSSIKTWKNIKQVYLGCFGIYGLTTDGRVLCAERDHEFMEDILSNNIKKCGQVNVSNLRNIKKIIGEHRDRLICLGENGNICTSAYYGEDVEFDDEISSFTDIEDVLKLGCRMICRTHEGKLVASNYYSNSEKCCIYSDNDKWKEMMFWKNIVKLQEGSGRIVGLDSTGKLYFSERMIYDDVELQEYFKYDPIYDFNGWEGLVDIKIRSEQAIGLKEDGTIIFAAWADKNGRDNSFFNKGLFNNIDNVIYMYGDINFVLVKKNGEFVVLNDETIEKANYRLFEDINNYEQEVFINKANNANFLEEKKEKENKINDEIVKINAIITSYIGAGISEKIKQVEEDIQQIDKDIDKIKKQNEKFEYYKRKLPEIDNKINSLKKSNADNNSLIEKLESEKASLGLFSGQKKKEIENNVAVIYSEICENEKKIQELVNSKNGYTMENIATSIEKCNKEIESFKLKIEKLKNENGEIYQKESDYKNAIEILKNKEMDMAFARKYPKEYLRINMPIKKGDVIKFGSYNDEMITWIVLEEANASDSRGNCYKAFKLITEKAISRVKYHDKFENIDWGDSYIRKWLNNEFLKKLLNEDQYDKCLVRYCDYAMECLENGGKFYDPDWVWILSAEMAKLYFKSDDERCCTGVLNSEEMCEDGYAWWLRDSGYSEVLGITHNEMAACVDKSGHISTMGNHVCSDEIYVRPCIAIMI